MAALWWFNSTTALLSDLAHHHYTCPHTLALDLGQNLLREAPPVLPPSAMPVTASLLPSSRALPHALDRENFSAELEHKHVRVIFAANRWGFRGMLELNRWGMPGANQSEMPFLSIWL